MTRQAAVGAFVLLAGLAIFSVFYVLGDIGTRSRGYKIGVHFQSAAGLHRAAMVTMSGVTIGAVDDIQLEPDYTVDVILAINPGYEIPRDSAFTVAAPFTGEPSVVIQPPRHAAVATLPHEILPLDEQPQGTRPASLQDLIEQGQGEARRFDRILALLEKKTPHLLNELDTALHNAKDLTTTAKESVTRISDSATNMFDTLNRSADRASNNIVDLTQTLDQTVKRNSSQLDTLLTRLNRTSIAINQSADSLREFATNPRVKQDLLETTHSFAVTAKTFAELTNDLRQVTGNAQTQAQLRDATANFDATAQRLASLLAQLGGVSSVYGVDKGATPAPAPTTWPPGFVPTSRPAVPVPASPLAGPPTPAGLPVPVPRSGGSPLPQSAATPAPQNTISPVVVKRIKERLDQFTKDLVQLQVRVSQLAPQQPAHVKGNTSPLLTSDRGPMTDFNVTFLPRGQTSLFTGINDSGGATSTANFMLLFHRPGWEYGGGMEYSRLGLFAAFNSTYAGLEARAYDLRHPTLDAYANIFVAPKLQLFGGERDITHQDRRAVFGFQFEI